MDFLNLRKDMIENQLKSRGIKDARVLQAFLDIPREFFVPLDMRDQAYLDMPLHIGENQTISQPYTVAFMCELLDLDGSEKVLEIGTGSGYGACILSKLCKMVYTIEIIPILAQKARDVLSRLHINNVVVISGDGSVGLEDYAPFDAISVTAGAPEMPVPLLRQLKKGGVMVVPIGASEKQEMMKVTKTGDGSTKYEKHGGFRFVPLAGEYGWKNENLKNPHKKIFKEKI